MYISFVFLIAICKAFSTQADDSQNEMNQMEEGYDKCDGNGTLCYGDTTSCIANKSCVYLTTFTETEEDFQIQFWDNCDHNNETHDFFFGVGMAPFDLTGEMDCNQPLEKKHFKLFLFWKDIRCPMEMGNGFVNATINEFSIQKNNWTFMCELRRNEISSLTREPLVFLLFPYLQRHLFFSVLLGYWRHSVPPYGFAETHNYFTNDGLFYLTSDEAPPNFLKNSAQKPQQCFSEGLIGLVMLSVLVRLYTLNKVFW